MKKVVISISSVWVKKILDKEKTLCVSKSVPNCGLPCEVYIYCGKKATTRKMPLEIFDLTYEKLKKLLPPYSLRGKIVAKFELKEAKKIIYDRELHKHIPYEVKDKTLLEKNEAHDLICKNSCLQQSQLFYYNLSDSFYVWKIDNLEIFDEYKCLKDFGLDKSPKNWCYVKE